MVTVKMSADPSLGDSFAGAINQLAAQQAKQEALKDVGKMGLTALGAGVAGSGAYGLFNVLKRNLRPKKEKSGPALLPLPFPVEKSGGFLSGDYAADKTGVPWYGPAMIGAGMGGLALGWKGMDSILESRRRAESQASLDKARQEFHDALMGQYEKPLGGMPKAKKEEEKASPMLKAGQALDGLWERLEGVLAAPNVKMALDLTHMGGQALSGYGVYGGMAGLLTGAMVYNQMNKRSRQAVLEKAMMKRDRRRAAMSPTEIYATPEPVEMEQ